MYIMCCALNCRVAALQISIIIIIIMSNSVTSNCYGAQPHNGVTVMMSTPVTSNCYGAQPYNRVNAMMSNPVALNCYGAQPYNRSMS